MTTAMVFGCTGVVGSQILATLLVTNAFPSIKTISRNLILTKAIILRPGMILGRDTPKAPLLERIVGGLNMLGQGAQDMIGMTNQINA